MMVDIKGFPGYKINENGAIVNKRGHLMRYALSNGYPRTALETYNEDGSLNTRYNVFVHRLVAEAFVPNPDPLNNNVVMHKDNDKLHFHSSNLKWGTTFENVHQAIDDGLMNYSTNKPKCIYEVSKDDDDVIKCKGCEGVAELIGFKSSKSIRPGIIKAGPYRGYEIKNTNKRTINPISFKK